MAKKSSKTRQQLADEAYLRNQELTLGLDNPEPRPARNVLACPVVPLDCPTCLKAMSLRSGWTMVFGDMLQCGGCGLTIEVPRPEWERFSESLHAYHVRMRELGQPLPKKAHRERGAG